MTTEAHAVFASRDQVAIREQDGAATAVLLEPAATAGRSTVIEIDATPDAEVAVGTSDTLRYAFVVTGDWSLRIGDQARLCPPGTTVQVPTGEVCRGTAGSTGGRLLVVTLLANE